MAPFKRKMHSDSLEIASAKTVAKKKKNRKKMIAIIALVSICVIIAFIIALNTVIVPNTKYNEAIALMEEGNIIDAYEALVALDGYKDSADKANSLYNKYKAEKLKAAKVGDCVFFGSYEQDNNTSNGKEDIKWLVLEVKGDKALVISKYALDCKPYHTSFSYVTWETCYLRQWLNNDFINSAFSNDEQARIPTAMVTAEQSPDSLVDQGNDTLDQVFLLSVTEVNKYFNSNSAMQCEATNYAVANGAVIEDYSGYCVWWVRSLNYDQKHAAHVYAHGGIFNGIDVINVLAIRPAMWIDINT